MMYKLTYLLCLPHLTYAVDETKLHDLLPYASFVDQELGFAPTVSLNLCKASETFQNSVDAFLFKQRH